MLHFALLNKMADIYYIGLAIHFDIFLYIFFFLFSWVEYRMYNYNIFFKFIHVEAIQRLVNFVNCRLCTGTTKIKCSNTKPKRFKSDERKDANNKIKKIKIKEPRPV